MPAAGLIRGVDRSARAHHKTGAKLCLVIYRRAVIEQRPPLLLRLKLLLRDVHPAVWRRVKLADSLSIADLHRVIQLLMGWDDDHLHRFRIHGRDYGIAYPIFSTFPVSLCNECRKTLIYS